MYPLYNVIEAQLDHYTSYAEAVGCAWKIEMRRMTEYASLKKRRKGNEGRSQSGNFLEGSKHNPCS